MIISKSSLLFKKRVVSPNENRSPLDSEKAQTGLLLKELWGKRSLKSEPPGRERGCYVTAQYFLGSVHAVAQTGEIVTASASGSQVPAYAFSSPNVIWVIGVQKIVPTLDEAITRVREYVLPLEDARMKKAGFPGSIIGKLLTLEYEMMPNRITAIFVKEKLGF